MKIHRFYMPDFVSDDTGGFFLEDKEQVHQITKVLRLKVGDRVQVFNGSGSQWDLEIADTFGGEIDFNVLNKNTSNDVVVNVRVYLPLIRKERFEWAIEKLTEIGVDSIVPVITERTLVKNYNIERLNKIAIEASEQSGRVTVPLIAGEPTDLSAVIKDATSWGASKLIVGCADADVPSLKDVDFETDKIALLVGPEGGFSDRDIEVLDRSDAGKIITKISFGPNTLRTETAAVVAAALLTTV